MFNRYDIQDEIAVICSRSEVVVKLIDGPIIERIPPQLGISYLDVALAGPLILASRIRTAQTPFFELAILDTRLNELDIINTVTGWIDNTDEFIAIAGRGGLATFNASPLGLIPLQHTTTVIGPTSIALSSDRIILGFSNRIELRNKTAIGAASTHPLPFSSVYSVCNGAAVSWLGHIAVIENNVIPIQLSSPISRSAQSVARIGNTIYIGCPNSGISNQNRIIPFNINFTNGQLEQQTILELPFFPRDLMNVNDELWALNENVGPVKIL